MAIFVRRFLERRNGESVANILHQHLTGREIQFLQCTPVRHRLGDQPLLCRLMGIHQLDHRRMTGLPMASEVVDDTRRLQGGDDLVKKALVCSPKLRHRGIFGGGVVPRLGDLQRGIHILQDDLPGRRQLIVDLALKIGEGVFEPFIGHPLKRERTGQIAAHRFHIPTHQFHRGDAARRDLVDERFGVGKGRPFAPQTESFGVGQIRDFRGARRRDVEDARLGECVLEVNPGEGLQGGFARPALAFNPNRMAHAVGFIKGHHALKILTQPLDHLTEPRFSWGLAVIMS